MEKLVEVLIRRDNLTKEDAEERIEEVRDQLDQYIEERDIIATEEICDEFFGLEADYIFDLL